jgi:putative acetyltransferase
MTIQVRHVAPGDAEAVHALLTSPHVVDGTMRLPFAGPQQTETRIAPASGMYKLVAVDGDTVVGFSELKTHPDAPRHAHAGEINMIVAREDMQGKGVGRTLMAAMVSLADDWLGLVRIGLMVWVTNTRAIGLYESFGFEKEGTLRAYAIRQGQLIDAIVMGRINTETRRLDTSSFPNGSR